MDEEGSPPPPPARRRRGGLSARLLAFNLLLVFIPAAGLLYLGTYEKQLLEAQERSMVQEGRILAAALSEPGALAGEEAPRILARLNQRLESRIRVVDGQGKVLADTSRLGPRRERPAAEPGEAGGRGRILYRVGAVFYALYHRLLPPGEPALEAREPSRSDGRLTGREVDAALSGRYGRTVRPSPAGQRSVTLSIAIPIAGAGAAPAGAVVVTSSTWRILQDLYAIRLAIFEVCLASIALAVVLSLLVSKTIARPLQELRDDAAAILDRRGRLRGSFRRSQRSDEIGELSRALHNLTARLEAYQRFLESFAAEVSHEFRNPLASIRIAAEMASESETEEDRRRFLDIAEREVQRMERLLSDLREMTRVDARLESEEQNPLSLNALLERVCEGYRLRSSRVIFQFDPPVETITIRASEERMAQVFENLLDNAASFSSEGSEVRVRLAREDGAASVRVSDHGPGIPIEHLPRIFERFFSWRPDQPDAAQRHTGLGLAIVRTIVEGYGGGVFASNNPEGGATFTVRMPASRTGVFQKFSPRA
ncbi:MAG: ATP-binding protein [Acidobacteriota bacterium]